MVRKEMVVVFETSQIAYKSTGEEGINWFVKKSGGKDIINMV